MQTENLKCFFVRYVITCHLTTHRASPNRFFAISLHDYLHYCGIFLARFQISGSMSLTQSLFFTMQTGIFKPNNLQLAGAKRSFPSEAAYYLLYADLGILRAKRRVIKLARSPCYIVQSCKHDLVSDVTRGEKASQEPHKIVHNSF